MASPHSVLQHLRTRTGEAHRALHVHPFMREHFEDHLTAPSYFGFLALFRALWRDFERAFDASARSVPSLRSVRAATSKKTPLLDLDLEGQEEVTTWIPDHHDPLLEQEPLHLLGYAYTLIGSSMGATQLLDRVQTQLPLLPTHYLSAAPDARQEWHHLHRQLNTLEVDCAEQHCVAHGALVCFERVHEGFDRLLLQLSPKIIGS